MACLPNDLNRLHAYLDPYKLMYSQLICLPIILKALIDSESGKENLQGLKHNQS